MIRIKRFMSIGYIQKREDIVEVNEEEWNSMSKYDQEDYLGDLATEFMDNYLDCGAYVIEEEK